MVEAPRDCKNPRGAPRPPPLGAPPEGLPGCGLDHFKAPRSCCCLKASRGLLENPLLRRRALERLWGANARKNPSGGARGRDVLVAVDWCYRIMFLLCFINIIARLQCAGAVYRR